jgi:hypothetical protein
VDGLPAGQYDGNFNEVAPSVEAVREFRLISSQIGAEYGNTGAAVTSFSIKSGTNEVHGSVFNYLRNDKLDARSWLAATRAPVRLNEFGGSAGGPVVLPRLYDGRNRTFWFFSVGGSRKRGLDQFSQVRIPTSENRLGDFSSLVNSAGNPILIYDPATTRIENGVTVRSPFPGNRIPAERIDPVAARIAALYPDPNQTGTVNYGRFTGEQQLDPTAWTGKFDHLLNDNHRLAATIIHTDIPRLRIDNPLPDPLTNGINQGIVGWTARVNYEAVLTPAIVNSAVVGFNRFRNPISPPVEERDYASLLGIPGAFNRAFPQMSFGDGYTSIGAGTGIDNFDWTVMAKDFITWSTGKHAFRFGGEVRYNQRNNLSFGQTNGSFAFNNALTASPTALAATGDSFASFLLGGARQVNYSFPFSTGIRTSYGGAFVQDEWRIHPRLTLTAGIRFESHAAPWENHDRYSGMDLLTPNPAAGGIPGALVFAGDGPGRTGSRTFASADLSAWGPRFGFAWRVADGTVLRGGYGVYYSNPYFPISFLGFNPTTQVTSLDNGLTPGWVLSQGIPPLNTQLNLSPSAANGQSVTFFEDSSNRLPRSQNMSFTVQRGLGQAASIDASYVGLIATRQVAPQLLNYNQVDPRYLSLGSLLTQNINSAAAVAAGIPRPYPTFTGTVAQALRPFPQYQTVSSAAAKAGKSQYHSMQLRLRQRFSAGLSLEANYTWSKALGYPADRYAFGAVNNLLQDHYNQSLERSLLQTDVPHAFVLQYVYDLPFGAGQRWVNSNRFARTVLGGWSWSMIHRYQTGTPLPILMNNTLPLFNSVLRPDVVPDAPLQTSLSVGEFQPTVDRRINLSAFRAPAPFQFGTAAPTYGNLRNFAVLQEDVSLTKRTPLTERFVLELYGQAYNVLNRHRFANFDTNFSSPNFGRARATNLPRFIQIGARIKF